MDLLPVEQERSDISNFVSRLSGFFLCAEYNTVAHVIVTNRNKIKCADAFIIAVGPLVCCKQVIFRLIRKYIFGSRAVMKIANGHKAKSTFMINFDVTFLRYTSGFFIAKNFTTERAK
jgi:hypothetical protein